MINSDVSQITNNMSPMATERLILRKISVSDASDMFEYASNEEVTRYLLWEPHGTMKFTKNYVKYLQKQYKDGNYFDWAITLKENGKMIGTCGFSSIFLEHSRAEIGYVVNPAYQNLGIATEAVGCVIRYAFEQLDINRVEAKFMIGNDASEVVMKKIGMKKEGVLREYLYVKGCFRDIGVYSITADEYFKLKYNIGE